MTAAPPLPPTITPAAAAGQAPARAAVDGIKAAAEAFETILLSQFVGELFAGSESAGFFGGAGSDVYRGMLSDAVAGALVAQGGIGIARSVMAELLALQEAAR